MQAIELVIAGRTFICGRDEKGQQYIGIPSIERALNLRMDSTREILASKSLKVLVNKEKHSGKKSISYKGTRYSCVPVDTFNALVLYLANKGNEEAQHLRDALYMEAIQRRIDNALGEVKTEKQYDSELIAAIKRLREKARKNYHPLLTIWTKNDNSRAYGYRTNQLKVALGLPKVTPDQMSIDELHIWECGLRYYDISRRVLNSNHNDAVFWAVEQIKATIH